MENSAAVFIERLSCFNPIDKLKWYGFHMNSLIDWFSFVIQLKNTEKLLKTILITDIWFISLIILTYLFRYLILLVIYFSMSFVINFFSYNFLNLILTQIKQIGLAGSMIKWDEYILTIWYLLPSAVYPVKSTFPVLKSKSLTVLSLEAVASISPLGFHRTHRTSSRN